jgi:ABC-2 type transport system ATP-binding protein
VNGSLIEIDRLSVAYGTRKAVDELSLEVPEGAVYALLGRNGAGKTSLVRCLTGMQKPDSGMVRLLGTDVWRRRTKLMQRVGFVPEDADAPPDMTTTEIIRFCSSLYERWDAAGANERLARFSVPLDVPFGRLSKGQRRQVSLAIALASSPELLILDDPTLGLDVVARKELFEEIVSHLAEKGTTVFITTHDLAGIEGIADRLGVLQEGKLVLNEEMEALKGRFRRIRYSSPAAVPDTELQQLRMVGVRRFGNGVEAVVEHFDELSLERFRNSSGVREIEVVPMSLEEIFIAIAGEERGQ